MCTLLQIHAQSIHLVSATFGESLHVEIKGGGILESRDDDIKQQSMPNSRNIKSWCIIFQRKTNTSLGKPQHDKIFFPTIRYK